MPRTKSPSNETITFSMGDESVTLTGEQFDNASKRITGNARKRARQRSANDAQKQVKQSESEPEKVPIIQITKIKISLNDSSLLRYDRVTKNLDLFAAEKETE